jgi:hypothetical protein
MSDIKITIDGEKYTINPRLTLGEYMNLQKSNKEDLNTPKLLEMITGIPENVIKKIDSNRTLYLVNKIMKEKMGNKNNPVQATFEFNGKLYGLETDLTKLNFGGFIDLEVFISEGFSKNLNKIVALYYRPIKAQLGKTYVLEPYDTEECLKRAEEFLNLPFDIVSGASSFFLQFTKTYTENTLHILKRKNKKMIRRMRAVEYMKKILPPKIMSLLPQDFIKIN